MRNNNTMSGRLFLTDCMNGCIGRFLHLKTSKELKMQIAKLKKTLTDQSGF